MTEEKKSLFDKAIDALTDRDEKEAAAKAAQEKALAEAAKKEADARAKIAAQKAAAQKAAEERGAALRATVEKAAAATAPKKGIVTVRSLRIRADHNTSSEVVAGLVDGDEVMIHSTWTDGKDTWAKLDKGWAAMVYDGETYIKQA